MPNEEVDEKYIATVPELSTLYGSDYLLYAYALEFSYLC